MKRIHLFFLGLIALTSHADMAHKGFIPGEEISYTITWAGIPLAHSTVNTDQITIGDKKLIRIRMVSKNYRAYSHIYNVNNRTEVIADPTTALPLRVEHVINEGRRHRNHLTLFDHTNQTALFYDLIEGTTNTVPIESNTQDVLTFLYSMRNMELETVVTNTHRLFVDGKLYNLNAVMHKEKNIKVSSHGKVRSVNVEPKAEFDGLFLREGKIFFWISKEKRRVVTCVQAKVRVGKIQVKLKKVSGPGDDFWNRKKQ